MYQALRHFKNRLPDGSIVRLQPGDDVVGFEGWPQEYKRAALATHMVRVRPANPEVGITVPPSVEDVRHWTHDAMRESVREQRKLMGLPEPAAEPVAPLAVETVQETVEASEPTVAPAEAGLFKCPQCDFETESSQGFKTHQARKHRD